jgi:D-aminoacyl-tRNA deacylase
MQAVIQRVTSASVEVDGSIVGAIERGWLVLLGVEKTDSEQDADRLAEKLLVLRAFEDDAGKMNLDVQQVSGGILVVSQFTIVADCRKGRRPSFDSAADPATAERLYEHFVTRIRASGLRAATGQFRAMMKVSLVNDGPVTFILGS